MAKPSAGTFDAPTRAVTVEQASSSNRRVTAHGEPCTSAAGQSLTRQRELRFARRLDDPKCRVSDCASPSAINLLLSRHMPRYARDAAVVGSSASVWPC